MIAIDADSVRPFILSFFHAFHKRSCRAKIGFHSTALGAKNYPVPSFYTFVAQKDLGKVGRNRFYAPNVANVIEIGPSCFSIFKIDWFYNHITGLYRQNPTTPYNL
jgi:hypothetical protein